VLVNATPVSAEQPDAQVPRTGNFDQRVPTPGCDDIGDTIEKYAGRGLNAASVLNPVRNLVEFIKAGGDPEKFVENQKKNLDEAIQLAGDATKFVLENPVSPFSTIHNLSKLLPDGNVKDFMSRIKGKAGDIGSQLVKDSLNTIRDDFLEVAGDVWGLMEKLDDPEAFFGELGTMYQKWNPGGAMTQIFTAENPAVGLRMAGKNLLRQADLASTYLLKTRLKDQLIRKLKKLRKLKAAGRLKNAGAARVLRAVARLNMTKASAKDILKHVMKDQLKESLKASGMKLIKSLKGGDKKAAALLISDAMAEIDRPSRSIPLHPLFSKTEVRDVKAQWMRDDHESGAAHDMSAWHPVVEDGSDCISLGDFISPARGHRGTLKALCGTEPGFVMKSKGDWWARPIDYVPVWNDSCSGGEHDRSIWLPKCPDGYVAAGVVAAFEGSLKPLPNRIACLKSDPSIVRMNNAVTAQALWATDDSGSGSKLDVTIYNRDFHGMQLSWAVAGYHDNGTYREKLELPISRTHHSVVNSEYEVDVAISDAHNAEARKAQADMFAADMRRTRRAEAWLAEEARHTRMKKMCTSAGRAASAKCLDYGDERYGAAKKQGRLDSKTTNRFDRRHWGAAERVFGSECNRGNQEACARYLAVTGDLCTRGDDSACESKAGHLLRAVSLPGYAGNRDADLKVAFDLFTTTCARGLGSSCRIIAILYGDGRGPIGDDIHRALEFRTLGCHRGSVAACMELADNFRSMPPRPFETRRLRWRTAYYSRLACEQWHDKQDTGPCDAWRSDVQQALMGDYTATLPDGSLHKATIGPGDGGDAVFSVQGGAQAGFRVDRRAKQLLLDGNDRLEIRYTTKEAIMLKGLLLQGGLLEPTKIE
jgi:TPR repeat protein